MKRVFTYCFMAIIMFGTTQVLAIPRVQNDVIIKGSYLDAEMPDSVALTMYYLPVITNYVPSKKTVVKVSNGTFKFELKDIKHPYYIDIRNANPIWKGGFSDYFLIEPGDNVEMKIKEYTIRPKQASYNGGVNNAINEGLRNIVFSGKGSAKYKFLYELKTKKNSLNVSVEYNLSISSKGIPEGSEYFLNWIRKQNEFLKARLALLESYKNAMSTAIFLQLKADLVGEARTRQLLRNQLISLENMITTAKKVILYSGGNNKVQHLTDDELETVKTEYKKVKQLYLDSLSVIPYVDEKTAVSSKGHIQLLIDKAKYEAHFNDDKQAYTLLRNGYNGRLRDYLISFYILSSVSRIKNRDEVLKDALKMVKDEICLGLLKNVAHNNKGVLAYQFALPGMNKEIVKLDDFKGKVVFMDFWYTGCGACSYFYKDVLMPMEAKFKDNLDLVYITVSIDKTRELWLKSTNQGLYTSPHSKNVVNLHTDGLGTNHDIIKHYNIIGYPRPLLIGKDGRIFSSDYPVLRTAKGLEEQINLALQQKKP